MILKCLIIWFCRLFSLKIKRRISVVFFIVCFLSIKSWGLSAFTEFSSEIRMSDYDINLSRYVNPLVWTGRISDIGANGIIRGATGSNISSLDGEQNQGFHFDANRTATFTNNIEFKDFNSLAVYGGALDINRSAVDFRGSFAFTNNTAFSGGSVYLLWSEVSFSGAKVDFKTNTADNYGGAMYVFDLSDLKFSSDFVEFSQNTSGHYGGAIAIVNHAHLTIERGNILFDGNYAGQFGGAAYINNGVELSMSGNIIFSNNSAEKKGGALWIGRGSSVLLKALNDDIYFTGNMADGKVNDIYIENGGILEFLVGDERKIVLEGGIEGGGSTIKKTGAGLLQINDKAIINYGSDFIAQEGRTELASPNIKISSLTVSPGAEFVFTGKLRQVLQIDNFISGGTITVNIDLKSFESDILEIQNTANISDESVLSINFYGFGTDVLKPISILRFPNGNGGSNANFSQISGNLPFALQTGPDGSLRVQLLEAPTMAQMLPYAAFYANLRTLPLSTLFDYGPIFGGERVYLNGIDDSKKSKSLWIFGGISDVNYKESIDSIDTFNALGQMVQAGVDVFENGGIFGSYQTMSAKQGKEQAKVDNIEIGLYKTFQASDNILFNIMGNFGLQKFNVENGTDFDSKSIKLSLEGEYVEDNGVNIFGALRGGYLMSDEIVITTDYADTTMEADNYLKLDLIAGLKKTYQIGYVILGGKIYGGLLIAGQDIEFKSDLAKPVRGREQEMFFGGAGIRADFEAGNKLNVFAGISAQLSGSTGEYLGYLGIGYKLKSSGGSARNVSSRNSDRSASRKRIKSGDTAAKSDEKPFKTFRLPIATFETGSFILSDIAKSDIASAAQLLKQYDIKKIIVEGHTDSIGEAAYNRTLSKNRAEMVYKELVRNGMPNSLMEYTGYFYLLPAASNKTESGKQMNRRAEILVEVYSSEALLKETRARIASQDTKTDIGDKGQMPAVAFVEPKREQINRRQRETIEEYKDTKTTLIPIEVKSIVTEIDLDDIDEEWIGYPKRSFSVNIDANSASKSKIESRKSTKTSKITTKTKISKKTVGKKTTASKTKTSSKKKKR